MAEHKKGILQRKIDHQVYEVSYGNDKIFSLPRGKKERLDTLRTFVFKECEKAWASQPREIATLKRQFLRELTDGIRELL